MEELVVGAQCKAEHFFKLHSTQECESVCVRACVRVRVCMRVCVCACVII